MRRRMRPSQIVFWSAITTIAGTMLAARFKVKVPGFDR